MFIQIDSDVLVPSSDDRFSIDDSEHRFLHGTTAQVQAEIEDVEEILLLLNAYNDQNCALSIDYRGQLRLVLSSCI